MNFKTLLVFALGFCGLTRFEVVNAEPFQSPLKARINHNVIRKMIALRDQEVFGVFKDTTLLKDDANLEHSSQVVFSLVPNGVPVEDFDFDVKISKEYFGAETDKVACEGVATLNDGTDVKFSAPINMIKVQYELTKKFNNEYNFEANHFAEKEWTFDMGAITGEMSDDAKAEIKTAVSAHMDTFKAKFEKGDKKGEMAYIENFPMDTVIPMACIYYITHFSEIFEVDDNFVALGFSLMHFKMLTEKQNKMLKAIKHPFYNEKNKRGEDALFQIQIDDNFFNSLTSVFASVDRSFSGREIMKQNPKTRPFVNMLTTTTIGTVLPTFKEEYGEDKNIDIMFSPSHTLFLAGFPNSKMTGIYIDKNGNWKVQVNIVMNLNVETSTRNWESARDIYMTAVFKFKVAVNDTNPFTKKYSVTPKNIEITNLKVLKGEEEMQMEQMMIQSVTNIQLENIKKMFKEFPFYMNDLLSKNPRELACLGFNVADLDVTFKKSQVMASAYYKETKYMDEKLCKSFMDELRQSPKKIIDQFNMKKNSPLLKGLKEAQAQAAGGSGNPFEALKTLRDEQAKAQKADGGEKEVHDEL